MQNKAKPQAKSKKRPKNRRRVSTSTVIMLVIVVAVVCFTMWLVPRLFGSEPMPTIKTDPATGEMLVENANKLVTWLSGVIPPANPANNPNITEPPIKQATDDAVQIAPAPARAR